MGKIADKLRAKYGDKGGGKRHRVNFLAHKADIAEALREGWPVKQIWRQMLEDELIAMCYSTFCAHVRREIPVEPGHRKTAETGSRPTGSAGSGTAPAKPATRTNQEAALEKLPEDERLELLKNEAFASVRSKKPAGQLIVQPKSRETEYRELFGEPESAGAAQAAPAMDSHTKENHAATPSAEATNAPPTT